MTGSETVAPRCDATPPGGAAALARRRPRRASRRSIRFAAAQAFTTPWIAPDEMVYGLIGESLWSSRDARGARAARRRTTASSPPPSSERPLALFDLADGIQLGPAAAGVGRVARRRSDVPLGTAAGVDRLGDRSRGDHPRRARAALRRLPDDGAADADRRHRRAPRARARGRGADDVAVRRSSRRGPRRRRRCGSRRSCSSPPSSSRSRWTRSPPATASRLRPLAWLAGVAALVALAVAASSSCVAASSRRRACSARTRRSARAPASTATGWSRSSGTPSTSRSSGSRSPSSRLPRSRSAVFARRDHDPALRAFVAVDARLRHAARRPGRPVRGRVRRARRRALPHHGAAAPRDRAVRVDRARSAARPRRRAPGLGLARRRRGADPAGADRRAGDPREHLDPVGPRGALGRPGVVRRSSPATILAGAIVVAVPRRLAWTAAAVVGVTLAARVVRQRPAHRRCLGARGSRRHGLGVADAGSTTRASRTPRSS